MVERVDKRYKAVFKAMASALVNGAPKSEIHGQRVHIMVKSPRGEQFFVRLNMGALAEAALRAADRKLYVCDECGKKWKNGFRLFEHVRSTGHKRTHNSHPPRMLQKELRK